MGAESFIGNMLRIAAEDLAGAIQLAGAGNRNAADLLEQTAEKTIRAVLVSESLHSSTKHELKNFVDLVPDINPIKPILRSIEHLAQYATTYQYPTSPLGLRPKFPCDPHSSWCFCRQSRLRPVIGGSSTIAKRSGVQHSRWATSEND